MGASAKVTTNAPAIPGTRAMMLLLVRSNVSDEGGTRRLLAVRAPSQGATERRMAHAHIRA